MINALPRPSSRQAFLRISFLAVLLGAVLALSGLLIAQVLGGLLMAAGLLVPLLRLTPTTEPSTVETRVQSPVTTPTEAKTVEDRPISPISPNPQVEEFLRTYLPPKPMTSPPSLPAFVSLPDPFFDLVAQEPLEELHLSPRAREPLRRTGITTVGQILATDPDDLLAIEGFEPIALTELRHKLVEFGYFSAPQDLVKEVKSPRVERLTVIKNFVTRVDELVPDEGNTSNAS